ncbi:hypothetical protein BIY21_05630 [Vibrio ponticus]|uniref:Uncharacterized protein n=1 Tax=Vibrio ponticus TaxID=265668 RepID=A0ABX3FND2_9VIBR|nr:hypothetical protein [Vibrio ponticus]OLQ95734.1 hypothetical protein BIY21_05630 [Vibrio ponticus]
MSKRLCKLNRHDIAQQLSDIQRIVAAPKYLCRSCARASQDKNLLCKPMALQAVNLDVPVAVEEKSVLPQQSDVLLTAQVESSESLLGQSPLSKSQLKQAKKQAKKQKKYFKKLKKTVDKQQKLLRKQQKLEQQFNKTNMSLNQLTLVSGLPASQHAMH